jgi:hypothetical protein
VGVARPRNICGSCLLFFSNVAIENLNSEETQKKSVHSNILKKSGKLQRKAVQGAYDCEISFL